MDTGQRLADRMPINPLAVFEHTGEVCASNQFGFHLFVAPQEIVIGKYVGGGDRRLNLY